MEGPPSQLSTRQVLQSLSGLKVKHPQQQTQTPCKLPKSGIEPHAEVIDAKDRFTTATIIRKFSQYQSKATLISLFDSDSFKTPKNQGFLKKHQTSLKSASWTDSTTVKTATAKKDSFNWKSSKQEQHISGAIQQNLEEKHSTDCFRSQIDRPKEPQSLDFKCLTQISTKERASTAQSRVNIFSIDSIDTKRMPDKKYLFQKRQPEIKEIPQKKQQEANLSNQVCQQETCEESPKPINSLDVTLLSTSQKTELDRIYSENLIMKSKRQKQSAKEATTSFCEFHSQIYCKLRIKHPGLHQYELVNLALERFDKPYKETTTRTAQKSGTNSKAGTTELIGLQQ